MYLFPSHDPKIFSYGNENESSWPPRFPEKSNGFIGYWDKETNTFKEGFPPNPNPKYENAPQIIFDSIKAEYHKGACRVIESRKEWELADKEHNTITFGSIKDSKPKLDAFYAEKKRKDELRRASRAALQAYKENPKEVRQKLEKQGEQQIETLKRSGLAKQLKNMGIKYE